MKAALLTGLNKIELADIPKPVIKKDTDVLIEVRAAGICGTDLHIYKEGRADLVYPRILGHELSGIVRETGKAVSRVSVGDHVVIDPAVGCGVCRTCRRGHHNVCLDVKCVGVHMDGGFAEYTVIPEENVYKIDERVPFEHAALAEPFSVASNILARASIGAEDRVLILGSGTIGMCTLIAARLKGAEVYITVRNEVKKNFAEKFGADGILNSDRLVEEQEEKVPGGFDVVVDAIGSTGSMAEAAKVIAPAGRIICLGFEPAAANIPINQITMKELSIIGSRMNCHRFPEVVGWLNQGLIPAEDFISARYSINDITKAFDDTLRNSGSLKTILRF